jgi:opacity protein-like surface antigen
MTTFTKSALGALTALAMCAPVAHAQDQRFRVSFTPAVATVSGDAELALGGSIGYRFSEHFWFEGDLTWIDAAAGGFRDGVFDYEIRTATTLADLLRRQSFGRGRLLVPNAPILPGNINRLVIATDGSTLIGTLGIRYELPVDTARFRPYVSGGLGINHTDQKLEIDPRVLAALTLLAPFDDSLSHTGYAFTAGAGASVRIAGQLWADADARYIRLSRDRDVMRLGGGVSIRF